MFAAQKLAVSLRHFHEKILVTAEPVTNLRVLRAVFWFVKDSGRLGPDIVGPLNCLHAVLMLDCCPRCYPVKCGFILAFVNKKALAWPRSLCDYHVLSRAAGFQKALFRPHFEFSDPHLSREFDNTETLGSSQHALYSKQG